MSEPTAPRGPGWWRPLHRADRRALWLLVLLPSVIFIGPAIFGHPAIAQDNLIQNFPLRVLAMHQVATGHLPLFNSLANSGTPLLGGLNAGALYPLNVTYLVLPGIAAWVLNLIVVYVTAAVGMYSLCRWHGFRSSAALLAALAFSFSGAMMGQMVHLGVIQGFALIPWMVLTELVVARSLLGVGDDVSWRRHVLDAVPAVVGFAAIWALTFLSGEPRAIVEFELLVPIVVTVELLVHNAVARATWRGRALVVAANVVGVAWGAGIALAQLLPGWAFITQSERANVTYQFFGSGSLALRWTSLLFDQDLFGGNGLGGTARYFSSYNLAEVTGFVGILSLCAVAAYASQLTSRTWRQEHRRLALYGVVIIVGLFATWGTNTPVGHLFHALPLFGKTRLQSRSLILVDFAATVLLGWWSDAVFSGQWAEAAVRGWRKFVTVLPAALAAVIAASVLVAPVAVEKWYSATQPAMAEHQTLSLLVHLLIALGCAALVLGVFRRRTRRWLVALFVADLLAFNIFADVGFATGSTSTMPTRAASTAVLGTVGRFALVDPQQTDFGLFETLGAPNMNVFTNLSSIQGYGSLVSDRYGAETGTHPLLGLDPCNFARGTYRQLRLSAVVLSWSVLSQVRPVTTPVPWCGPPQRTTSTSRFFGTFHSVTRVTLAGWHHQKYSNTPVTVQFFDGDGRNVGAALRMPSAHKTTLQLAQPVRAAGFSLASSDGLLLGSTTISTDDQGVRIGYNLNGPFQSALASPSWRLSNTTAAYGVFRATSVLPAQWLATTPAHARITTVRSASWGDQWITVTSRRGTTLVRSVAWLAGWRADATNTRDGRSITLVVRRDGLIQRVALPAGTWEVHFHYHAPYIELGVIVSFVSSLMLALALALIARPRWHQWRRGSVHA